MRCAGRGFIDTLRRSRAVEGRSPLPERADLIRGVVHHVVALSRQAVERAEPHSGPVEAALRRVVEEHFQLGSILMYVDTEPLIVSDPSLVVELDAMERTVDEVLARPDSRLNPQLSSASVRRTFWGLLYAGWETARAGEMTRQQIVDSIMTTLTCGVYASRPSEAQQFGPSPGTPSA